MNEVKEDNIQNNTVLGHKGELLAAQYLQSKGYKIVDTNWRFYHREIDIVAQYQSFVVFVEVKLRHYTGRQLARESVSRNKEKLLIDAAETWIQKNNHTGESRFDLIAITLWDNKYHIEHIENAFNPSF
jgi:putative endonuclease